MALKMGSKKVVRKESKKAWRKESIQKPVRKGLVPPPRPPGRPGKPKGNK